MLEENMFETVTIRVPKALMQLLRDFAENPEAWLEKAVVQMVERELDSHIPETGCLVCRASILRKYGLEKSFQNLRS